jgi:hypothetical protein
MKQFITNDLSFAAYLMMKGCSLMTADKLGKTFRFTIDIGENSSQTLKIQFINSEAAKFDAAVRDLKKIMFSGGAQQNYGVV